MEAAHAILSPSNAHRWLVCTPSARFEEQIPEEESQYAAEGTLAHELAALLLSARSGQFKGDQKTFNNLLDKITADPLYSAEMLEYCEDYASYVVEKAGGAYIYIEHQYDMSKYIPLQFGTADASFFKDGTIYVIDFKYGAGKRVIATANKQMMCYGLGAYDKHKSENLTEVFMVIFQPRAGGVSDWGISVEELLKWAKTEAGPKGKAAIAGQGDFIPGEHCQFCKARTICKAFYDQFAEIKRIKDTRVMTDDDLAIVLTHGADVATWVKKVEEDTVKRLEGSETIKGFKLVEGRGRRSFKNEDTVVDILLGEGFDSEQIFDSKLQSLTNFEKLLGKKRFNQLFDEEIIKVPGKPQIASADDARPAICGAAADDYDEVDLT